MMIINYLKTAIRNFKKYKGYFFINVFGLSLGISACLLITLWIWDELRYDHHHEKADRIFRIGVHSVVQDNLSDLSTCSAPMAETLVREFPEVEAAGRIRRFGNQKISFGDQNFIEKRLLWCDNSLLNVFTIPIHKGDRENPLAKPNTVIISEDMAAKYFGEMDPIGKTLILGRNQHFKVTALMKNTPRRSHVQYDFLASLETIRDSRNKNYISNNYHTYFVLREGVSLSDFKEKLKSVVTKYLAPQVKQALGVSLVDFYASGGEFDFILQPITDIHLGSNLRFELEPNGNIIYVYIFMIVAIAILLIACINFVNLATARSMNRAREVGVRKAVGSSRRALMVQFITETCLMSFFSILASLLMVELLLPLFNRFTGKILEIPYLTTPILLPLFLFLALVLGFLAGIYPALFLSSFRPVDVLKGRSLRKQGSLKVRNMLVLFQFTVSIILIIGTLVVSKQMSYIQDKNLGFDRNQILLLPINGDAFGKVWTLKKSLASIPGVHGASVLSNLMGDSYGDGVYKPVGLKGEEKKLIWRMWADRDFLKTYQISLARGRIFDKPIEGDRNSVLINETCARMLGFDNPLNRKLKEGNREYQIIGIIKDFHFQSLERQIKPLAVHPLGEGLGGATHLSIKIEREGHQRILERIRDIWFKTVPKQSFTYRFFNDHFEKIYLKEQKTGQVFLVFAVMAIFIACLGLFALSSYVINQSTKEIGIRKVLGASIGEIYLNLVKRFVKWAVVANLIAWPVAYLAMNRWLNHFAYQADLSLPLFVVSAILTLLIAILTVTIQSINAAMLNPVQALRYE